MSGHGYTSIHMSSEIHNCVRFNNFLWQLFQEMDKTLSEKVTLAVPQDLPKAYAL